MFGAFAERLVSFETAGGDRAHVIGPLLLRSLLRFKALSISTVKFRVLRLWHPRILCEEVLCISVYI